MEHGTEALFRWDEPIIDIHAHPRGLGDAEPLDTAFIDEEIAYSRRLGVLHMVSLGEVLFRRTGYSAVEIRWLNDRNAELARHGDGFYLPFCFVDPTLGREFVREEVARCHEELGFVGIKLEVACNVAHPATGPVFEVAAERNLPVMVHATDTSTIGNRDWQSDPTDVRTAVSPHPNATVIVAHLTALGVRGVWELADLPNVHVDTSGMQPDADIVEYAVEALGPQRVVFGSDMYGRDLPTQIGQVLGAGISKSDKAKLFRGNALRLLRMEEKEEPSHVH
jgi:uncharacterized protein